MFYYSTVGDGNHSLATAKACYENLKKTMSEEEAKNSLARYALVEVVNLHSDALEFEPIHRVVFGVEPAKMIEEFEKYYQLNVEPTARPLAINVDYNNALELCYDVAKLSLGRRRCWMPPLNERRSIVRGSSD